MRDTQHKHLNTVQDYINSDLLSWLRDYNLEYVSIPVKIENGRLEILFNDIVCIKIYDRLGHGYGVTINLADKYDDSLYENDSFSLYWIFEYFKLNQTASFESRTESQYEQNMSNLISDLKVIIPILCQLTSTEFEAIKDWTCRTAKERFM